MSLLVDRREGSKHLVKPLQRLGVETEITELPFGDVCFQGRGIGDTPLTIGVELKKLPDLVASLRSGRLADHQVPGMIGPEGMYNYAWLVIEGQYRVNTAGQLLHQTPIGWRAVPGGMNVAELEKQVLTLELCSGMHVRFTNRETDTVQFVVNLYRWFTDKAMDAHTSHLIAHQPNGIIPLSDFRATLMVRCPHMGRASSAAAEVRFGGSLRKAAMATVDDWAGVVMIDRKGKTKRLGARRAEEIVTFWRHEA